MFRRFVLASTLLGAGLLVSGAAPTPPHCRYEPPRAADFAASYLRPYVYARSFRSPKWAPIDFNFCSVPIGDEESDFAEFAESLQTILPEPHHRWHEDLGIGPGEPHLPPYYREMRNGVEESGFFVGRTLTLSQFRNGNGALLSFMLVPQGARGMEPDYGSSPDFDDGPIISNSLLPISFVGVTSHNLRVFSAPTEIDVKPLDGTIDPPFDVDGHSHVPMFLVNSADFATLPRSNPDFTGVYRYLIRMEDQEGRGWNIDVYFVVVRPYN